MIEEVQRTTGMNVYIGPSGLFSFFPLPDIDAHDHEPQHERHLSEERGEGDVRDYVLAFSAAA
jgi:hypothetical protein